ncbi:MAG: hypothetical protein QXP44_06195 [Candidatus Bathyarchaeia archaeon]
MYKEAALVLVLLVSIANSQTVLTDQIYHFSVTLPAGWTYEQTDSEESFTRFKCFNHDSTAMMKVFALKAMNKVKLDKFTIFISAENGLGESIGTIKRTINTRISKIDAREIISSQSTQRGSEIDVLTLVTATGKYGYVVVFRVFHDVDESKTFKAIIESFNIEKSSSPFWKLILFGLVGLCLYGFLLGIKRTIDWFGPLKVSAVVYSIIVAILCLAALVVIGFTYKKIEIWMGIVSAAVFGFMILKIGDAQPVIKAYEEVKKKNTASAYREFCQKHKALKRYYKDARNRMRILMDDVVKKYKALIATHNTTITNAILAMFEHIKKTDNFQVAVHYAGRNNVKDYTEFYRLQRGLKVLPAKQAFTDEKNKTRENWITKQIIAAFRQITPEDILDFYASTKREIEKIIFEIGYNVNESGALYFPTREENLPPGKRTWTTGVDFTWSLEINIPNHENKYRISFASKPAAHFTASGEESIKIYDAMADSAFTDFCRVFIEQSGLIPTAPKS